jgi:hypothetical protein
MAAMAAMAAMAWRGEGQRQAQEVVHWELTISHISDILDYFSWWWNHIPKNEATWEETRT